MDPEAAPRPQRSRLYRGGGDRHHPAAHAGLRELHLHAIQRDRHQLSGTADRRPLEPVPSALDSNAGRIDCRDPAEESARHRLSLSAVDDSAQLHVARQLDRDPWRETRPGDAAHPHPTDPATDGTQEAHDMNAPVLSRIEGRPDVSHAEMANAIRFLAIDAVEKAKSGHPGMPMGMADVATVLFSRFLKFDPTEPAWPDRDRFVLSAGHGSMLLYALLHLTGYEGVTLDELRAFRQWGSKTPGHPEYGHTPGVETTTGPLGQGIATAVGMALAERLMNARFGDNFVDHFTYGIAGDGCLMEGLSHEAISLAGHLRINRHIGLFDDNEISICGATSLSCSDDQLARFKASGWSACRIDGHDPEAIAAAIERARSNDRSSLIACRTLIGFGAPNRQGSEKAHGAPLGADEVAKTRDALCWPHQPFQIPETVLAQWRKAGARGHAARLSWIERTRQVNSVTGSPFHNALNRNLPCSYTEAMRRIRDALATGRPDIATRQASQLVIDEIAEALPNLLGGSADLTHSNLTRARTHQPVRPDFLAGSYIHYGVREHAMAAAMNGIALHGGFIPYAGTFLTFADYSRPAIRLAALMRIRAAHGR